MSVRVLDLEGLTREFISLSKREIRTHLSEIPHFRSPGGGKLLFRTDEILTWLERYRAKPVNLQEAHEVAEALTTGRRQERRTG